MCREAVSTWNKNPTFRVVQSSKNEAVSASRSHEFANAARISKMRQMPYPVRMDQADVII
jgi:hypothetical protein